MLLKIKTLLLFTLSKPALFLASCFLVHVALNANADTAPLPWGDEQTKL